MGHGLSYTKARMIYTGLLECMESLNFTNWHTSAWDVTADCTRALCDWKQERLFSRNVKITAADVIGAEKIFRIASTDDNIIPMLIDWDDIAEANARAQLLAELRASQPELFTELVTAAERPARIARAANIPEAAEVDTSLFEHPMESRLLEEFAGIRDEVETLLEDKSPDRAQVAALLAGLLPVIHQYFEDVMVMVEDEALRRNRLTLLRNIDQLFLRLADFLEIVQRSD